uniref:Beta-1,3-galactosyltransferase 5-like protein isoform X2 n=1 Tax=Triatoma infestans TaxID=30076 RepID=A0A170X2U3_TRIIF
MEYLRRVGGSPKRKYTIRGQVKDSIIRILKYRISGSSTVQSHS